MTPPKNLPSPDYKEEENVHQLGFSPVAGLDEVGRGCLAGPVVSCAVILNPLHLPTFVCDSKLVDEKTRQTIKFELESLVLDYSIGQASVEEIDALNILQATKLSMQRAIAGLKIKPKYLLLDGNFTIQSDVPQKSIIKGDQKVLSIAAASILAKVYRDEKMRGYDLEYPGYAFASNKGYGSVAHREGLMELGLSPIHRKTFQWKSV